MCEIIENKVLAAKYGNESNKPFGGYVIMGIDGQKDIMSRIEYESNYKRHYIPARYLTDSVSFKSNFIHYLCGLFTREQIEGAMNKYGLGATKDGGTIFWQIDFFGRIRSGKIIHYHSEDHPDFGHRDKKRNPIWVHDILKKRGEVHRDFHLEQCLFGEHLLSPKLYPDKKVALVEAEKTAFICSMIWPEYNWVAVGGRNNFTEKILHPLFRKDVVVFPDTDPDGDTFKMWYAMGFRISQKMKTIYVSDYLERKATAEQKAHKIDIADLLLDELQTEYDTKLRNAEALERLKQSSPAFAKLIDSLQLYVL